NCRFGDPEIQAILPLVETDFVDLMLATVQGRLNNYQLQIKNMAAVCVVMASGGYPGFYEKGKTIHGLDRVDPDILIFHAGTKVKGRNLVTSGGRVLGITAMGETIKSAVQKVYRSIGNITFDGAYYRRDIGHRALTLNKIKSPSSTT
ncbi:phosphoribosylamine--glycine ligase, partial [bacterium]|nr:phosphoribosylamine--glycine ligase [bacterium]